MSNKLTKAQRAVVVELMGDEYRHVHHHRRSGYAEIHLTKDGSWHTLNIATFRRLHALKLLTAAFGCPEVSHGELVYTLNRPAARELLDKEE